MDERVYEVPVCTECFTQVAHDADGNLDPCPHCDALTNTTVRFRVARAAVLKQADPHQSLVERTLYFGCVGDAGHYYWHRSREGFPYKARGPRGLSIGDYYASLNPWGTGVENLFGRYSGGPPVGEAHVFHLDGWTALAFQDNSVDRRPGSWSVYCIPAILDGPEALLIARAAFPPIFARYTFDVRLAT